MSQEQPPKLPPLYYVYCGVTSLMAPLLYRQTCKKLKVAGLPKARRKERAGHASMKRPLGPLVWLHAVSVGELQSVLGMIEQMLSQDSRLQVLVTTTTATAAQIAQDRLPDRAFHQFAPLDTKDAVSRFLDHWVPDLAVFVESELWPRQIVLLNQRDIPTALINARLSEGSLKSWKRMKYMANALLGRLNLVLCQGERTRAALQTLSRTDTAIEATGDLKRAAAPLPVDEIARQRLAKETAKRPIWLAASTHDGEEAMILEAHKDVLSQNPDALLTLIPRHPERGPELQNLIAEKGLSSKRRSLSETPDADTHVYLADTLGETGLFFCLCPVVFVGGSFVEVGGHNPYEPAHFNCAILHGPYYANFQNAYQDMNMHNACRECADTNALSEAVIALQKNKAAAPLQSAALSYIKGYEELPKQVADRLFTLLRTS